jgi:hypothetical protein
MKQISDNIMLDLREILSRVVNGQPRAAEMLLRTVIQHLEHQDE